MPFRLEQEFLQRFRDAMQRAKERHGRRWQSRRYEILTIGEILGGLHTALSLWPNLRRPGVTYAQQAGPEGAAAQVSDGEEAALSVLCRSWPTWWIGKSPQVVPAIFGLAAGSGGVAAAGAAKELPGVVRPPHGKAGVEMHQQYQESWATRVLLHGERFGIAR